MSTSKENQKNQPRPEDTASSDSRKDYIGKSGVYPMSGPHPAGDAPLRGQLEWGQGERGAFGYEDHGGSELSLDSGVLVGGLDKDWATAAGFETGCSGGKGQEIAVGEWPVFCEWLSRNFKGIETSIERRQGRERVAECRNRPLQALSTRLTENRVGEIRIAVGTPPRERIVAVPGPREIRMLCNAAGWPTALQIVAENAEVWLRFTGTIDTAPVFTGNSWGE